MYIADDGRENPVPTGSAPVGKLEINRLLFNIGSHIE